MPASRAAASSRTRCRTRQQVSTVFVLTCRSENTNLQCARCVGGLVDCIHAEHIKSAVKLLPHVYDLLSSRTSA